MYLLIHLEAALILLKRRPQNDELETTPKYKAQLPQPCVQGCVNGYGQATSIVRAGLCKWVQRP